MTCSISIVSGGLQEKHVILPQNSFKGNFKAPVKVLHPLFTVTLFIGFITVLVSTLIWLVKSSLVFFLEYLHLISSNPFSV